MNSCKKKSIVNCIHSEILLGIKERESSKWSIRKKFDKIIRDTTLKSCFRVGIVYVSFCGFKATFASEQENASQKNPYSFFGPIK